VFAAAGSAPAAATTIVVQGTWGGDGADGAYGEDGTPGGDGGAASGSTADPFDWNHRVLVLGGHGGAGGDGGEAIDEEGASGNGANGGAGGSAVSTSTSLSSGFGTAEARGGRGGDGGLPGGMDALGGNGAAGGDARADAVSTSATGSPHASANAEGGHGGSGRIGGAAGDATAHAEAHSGEGGASAYAEAEAGWAGSHRLRTEVGLGGASAQATARATSTGGGASARVLQIGGGGGGAVAQGGDGADSVLEDAVSGSAAIGNDGYGTLALGQSAVGGDGGSARELGGSGGDAMSTIDATNPGGGHLDVRLSARGGAAGSGSSAGAAGDAFVSGTAVGERNVTLLGTATGGKGSAGVTPSPGSAPTLGPLFAHSLGGGSVWVRGEAIGGEGARPTAPIGQTGASGASVLVVDAVDGATTGSLTLEQRAIAGQSWGAAAHGESRLTRSSSAAETTATVHGAGGWGQWGAAGGDATALLRLSSDTGSITANASAFGGGGANAEGTGFTVLPSAAGGRAFSDALGTTTGAGRNIIVNSSARSGSGGASGDQPRAADGDAEARAEGTALGDSRVEVAADAAGGNAIARAVASNQGSARVRASATANAGTDLGSANASAYGSSLTGAVEVSASQFGGNAVSDAATQTPADGGDTEIVDAVDGTTGGALTLSQSALGGTGSAFAGRGGDATSLLSAVDRAGMSLTVYSEAQGGWGGNDGGAGGNAHASARGEEHGAESVRVTARAIGGEGTRGPDGGDGGLATIGEVFGRSGSGDVHVIGWATGGNGVDGFSSGGRGSGASVELVDVVDGETSGHLTLEQIAEGGETGHHPTSQPAYAGNATSRLTRSKSAAYLTLRSVARPQSSFIVPPPIGVDGSLADARADAENDTGVAEVLALAEGGSSSGFFGAPGPLARGGDANVEARARTLGDGHDVLVGRARTGDYWARETGAFAGDGGTRVDGDFADPLSAAGGRATSRSTGIAEGDSVVRVYDYARGGWGGEVRSGLGFRGGDGGAASSIAYGENHGASAVSVRAEAVGGRGGSVYSSFAPRPGGLGGEAVARATGISESGDVDVTAVQRGGDGGSGEIAADGADSTLIDAVSGSTAGRLVLLQEAIGGLGGSEASSLRPVHVGSGGDAFCSLTATNPGGGALELTARAVGGGAGAAATGEPGGQAGHAQASAVGSDSTGAELVVRAQAVGGGGLETPSSSYYGAGARGGDATLGEVRGSSSAGGDVTVIGEATGGNGGSSYAYDEGADGGDAVIEDAVDGATTGSLTLVQRAHGGWRSHNGRSNGLGQSRLTKSGSFERLALEVEASGRLATAEANASNQTGNVDVVALAKGVSGGAAEASASGEAFADGTSVTIGRDRPDPNDPYAPLLAGALGGEQAYAGNGRGGDAFSSSTGVHHGNGAVSVRDVAIGGNADAGRYENTPGDTRGGNAHSHASASNQGRAAVDARAYARGGAVAYRGVGDWGGVAASADAFAEASGRGAVLAWATAERGWGTLPGGGSALARAHATGAEGLAFAEASERIANPLQSGVYRLATRAGGEVDSSTARSAAWVGEGALAAVLPSDVDALAAGAASPDAGVLLSGGGRVAQALAGTLLLAHGQVDFANSTGDPNSLRLGAELELGYERGLASGFRIGFLDAELLDGLGRLSVTVSDGGRRVWSKDFTKAEKIVSYFEDRSIAVKSKAPKRGPAPSSILTVSFEAVLRAPGDGVALEFLIGAGDARTASLLSARPLAVPEARAWWLLALAAAALARRCARAQPPTH
jgi:hypothetical protein